MVLALVLHRHQVKALFTKTLPTNRRRAYLPKVHAAPRYLVFLTSRTNSGGKEKTLVLYLTANKSRS